MHQFLKPNPEADRIFSMDVLEDLRDELRGMAGRWLTRQQAANYLGSSVSEIDRLAFNGLLTRHWLCESPRFDKADLDKLVKREKYKMPGREEKQIKVRFTA